MALAIVEARGTTYGTTKTAVATAPDRDLLFDLLLLVDCEDEDMMRSACESIKVAWDDAAGRDGRSVIDIVCGEDEEIEDGIERICDTSKTEYWRSHMWMTISVDDEEMPARRTWVDVKGRSATFFEGESGVNWRFFS